MAQLSFIDPGVNTALGLAGGYYGLAGNFLRAGNTKLGEAMAAGRLPGNRADVEKETGGLERLHPRAFVSPFPNGDVVCVEYSGGGGYGDPLDRPAQPLRAPWHPAEFAPIPGGHASCASSTRNEPSCQQRFPTLTAC